MRKKSYCETIDVAKFRDDLNGECKRKYESFSEVARQIGYTPASIGNVARGADLPSKRMVTAVCMLMGYTPDRYKKVEEVVAPEPVKSEDMANTERLILEVINNQSTIISQNTAIIECINKLIEEFK